MTRVEALLHRLACGDYTQSMSPIDVIIDSSIAIAASMRHKCAIHDDDG